MPDERTPEHELNRFWNEVVRGGPVAGGFDLDPDEMEAVRRLHRQGAAPLPRSAEERAWREVLARIEAGRHDRENPPPGGSFRIVQPAFEPNGRASRNPGHDPEPRIQSSRRRWALAQVATAALVVLTLVGVLVAFGTPRTGDGDGRVTRVPAVAIDSSVTGGGELLVGLELARDALPDPVNLELWRGRIAPGERSVLAAGDHWASASGTAVEYVLAGGLVLRVEAPFRVVRSGTGVAEEVAAGAEVELAPGDAAIYPFEQPRTYVNPGPEATELLLAAVTVPRWEPPWVPTGYTGYSVKSYEVPEAAATAGLIPMSLRELAIPAGTPAPEQVTTGPRGVQVTVGERSRPATPTAGEQQRTVYVLTFGRPPPARAASE